MTKIYPPNKYSQALLKASKIGDLESIQKFIDSEMETLDDAQTSSLAIQMLLFASRKGYLNICQAIWDAPKLNKRVNNFISLKNLLSHAIVNGNINTTEFFIDKLKEKKINYNTLISSNLIKSVQNGHLNIVKYFLLDNPFPSFYEFEFKSHCLLNSACGYNKLNILQFLLETDGIKEKYNIHKDNDCLFKLACENEHIEIIKYFIFDNKIENTQHIKEHLKLNSNKFEYITKWFELRDLQKSLNEDLLHKEVYNKKLKV